jgi:aspartate racemase
LSGSRRIDDRTMDVARIDAAVPRDTTEIWDVGNRGNTPHKFVIVPPGERTGPPTGAASRPRKEHAMKRIGLLGGMSWESSIEYYRLVNEAVRDRLGGLHSADCIMRSVDFAPIEELQRTGRWDAAGDVLAEEARTLEAAGAELLVLCTNTMHRVADRIADAVDVPFVHIADTTADAVRAAGVDTVGLLATAYTMEQDFYTGRLRDRHELTVRVPDDADRRVVHDVIYRELCVGIVRDESRAEYRRIMRDLADRGAKGILLGCTEIDLLVGANDSPVPTFDTTRLHAEKAVELALEGSHEAVIAAGRPA